MDKFRAAIARTLGIPTEVARAGILPNGGGGGEPGEFAPVIDARRFSPYTRKRIYSSRPYRPLGPVDGPQGTASAVERGVGEEVDQRPRAPEGYATHDARARPLPGGTAVGVPVPSGLPLLYAGSMLNIAHYRITPLRITHAMPEHVREGFRSIMASRGLPGSVTRDPGRERKADAAAQWMHKNGALMDFHAPRANERARAFGMGRYLADADLGLPEKELFDATGNMFDKDALLVRVGCPIKRWVSGEPVPTRDTYPHPHPGGDRVRGSARVLHGGEREAQVRAGAGRHAESLK